MISYFIRRAFFAVMVFGYVLASAAGTGSGPMTQSDINAISDSAARAVAQWQYDQAKAWPTLVDGIERSSDTNQEGKQRKYFTPQKLTAADCLTGRHWESVGGYAGCVCDGDATHTRVSNDQPAACTVAGPTVKVTRSPSGGTVGTGFTVTWTTTNATSTSFSCSGAMPGSGTVAANGSSNGTYMIVGTTTCNWTATGPGGSAATTESFTVNAAPVVLIGTNCVGTSLYNSYSDGSQVLIESNSATCGYVPPVTLTGQMCSGTTLMNMYSDGSQQVSAINSPICGWTPPVVFVGQMCSGTTLMNMYSDGSQQVSAFNSPTCGWTAPDPLVTVYQFSYCNSNVSTFQIPQSQAGPYAACSPWGTTDYACVVTFSNSGACGM